MKWDELERSTTEPKYQKIENGHTILDVNLGYAQNKGVGDWSVMQA